MKVQVELSIGRIKPGENEGKGTREEDRYGGTHMFNTQYILVWECIYVIQYHVQ